MSQSHSLQQNLRRVFNLCSCDTAQKILSQHLSSHLHLKVSHGIRKCFCPATCRDLFSSRPCTAVCVETCQCDPGVVLDGDICVPQCGCTQLCVTHHLHQTLYLLDSSAPGEQCAQQNGLRGCVLCSADMLALLNTEQPLTTLALIFMAGVGTS